MKKGLTSSNKLTQYSLVRDRKWPFCICLPGTFYTVIGNEIAILVITSTISFNPVVLKLFSYLPFFLEKRKTAAAIPRHSHEDIVTKSIIELVIRISALYELHVSKHFSVYSIATCQGSQRDNCS